MKKALKILLIGLLSVLCILSVVACNNQNDVAPEGETETIDYDGKYTPEHTDAFGYSPDLEDVVIDGHLDEKIWTRDEQKWYTNYKIENPNFKFSVTATMTDGGLYIAAKSNDSGVFFSGRNYFYYNTYVKLYFPQFNKTYTIDANGLPPTVDTVNIRSRYDGVLNANDGCKGFYVEGFITWKQLGALKRPEYVSILPSYYWNTKQNAACQVMPSTFVKGTGATAQAIKFDENGYMDADDSKATVGSHTLGLGKTNGWEVRNPGDEKNETVVADNKLGKGYAKAIFFRNLRSNRYMLTTRVTVNGTEGTGRAGLLMYSNNVNYRAYAIEINSDTFVKNKLTSLPIKGYTNYPSNITSTTSFADEPVSTEDGRKKNQFDLTVFANAGNMYYLVNGKFIYSEEASYIQDSFAGFYAYNANVEFTNYKAKAYNTEEELKKDIAEYVYTVEIKNEKQSMATATLSQIATANTGEGSVDIDVVFRAPRNMGASGYKVYGLKKLNLRYVDTGEEIPLIDDFRKEAKAGHFTIKNIKGNVIITTEGYEKDDVELVTLKGGIVEKQTGDGVNGAVVELYGSKPEDRFNITTEYHKYETTVNGEKVAKTFDGYFATQVPVGSTWYMQAIKTGFRTIAKSDINKGQPLDADMTGNPGDKTFEIHEMTSSVVGGTTKSADDAWYNPKTGKYEAVEWSTVSSPGTYWDLTEEEAGKVVFTTTNTGSSNIYYSGKTAAEYQVAYVELTNQTDYMAFSSIEDDPAVGFIITTSTGSVLCSLRQTGVRILPTSEWADHIDINGLINTDWVGGIAKIDRNDGGRVDGVPSIGNGSVNRVPVDGNTYTTSFLMIRRGGNVYLYAANGRAGLTENSTAEEMLSKMEPFYHGYIPQAKGVAAIGFGITVMYNLRIDFENYWILAGQKAAGAFADDLISNELVIEGNQSGLVDIQSDGLLSLDEQTGTGRIATDSSINFTAKQDVPAGKAICVTVNGESVYLGKKDADVSFALGSKKEQVKIKVEMVAAATVTGKLACGNEVFKNASGTVVDPKTKKKVASFVTDSEGKFSVIVERNRTFEINANVNGYAMENKTITPTAATANIETLEFQKLTIGQRVGSLATDNGMKYGIDKEKFGGAYANWETSSVGDATLTINPEYNNKTDFVLSFNYIRSSAAENGIKTTSDESDLGLGVVFSGDDAGYAQFLNIGTGYRFLRGTWGNRLEQRGLGRVDFQRASIGIENYAQVKIVKKGGMIFLFTKYKNDEKYTLTTAQIMVNDSGTPILAGQVAFAIKMTVSSGKYLNITFFDIKAEDLNEQTAPEIFANVTVNQTQGGTIAVDGQTSNTFRVESGAVLALTVTPDAEKKVAKVLVNGEQQNLGSYNGGVLKLNVTTIGETTITVEYTAVTYKTTVGGLKTKQLNAAYVKVTDKNGNSRVLKITKVESGLNEENPYLNETDKTLTLFLAKGSYTLTLCSDRACTKALGSELTVEVK